MAARGGGGAAGLTFQGWRGKDTSLARAMRLGSHAVAGSPYPAPMKAHADAVRTYWESAEARDWAAFGSVLAADVVYEMQQTRERVRGREAYVRFNQGYPGDWHLTIDRIVVDDRGAASWTTFTVEGESMTGIAFFTFNSRGAIDTVQDVWPESYEPPAGRAHLTERF